MAKKKRSYFGAAKSAFGAELGADITLLPPWWQLDGKARLESAFLDAPLNKLVERSAQKLADDITNSMKRSMDVAKAVKDLTKISDEVSKEKPDDKPRTFTRGSGQTHYSLALRPKDLMAFAAWSTDAIQKELRPGEVPVLCFTGFSGSATATAISLEWTRRGIKHGSAYIRKTEERSHGTSVEYMMPNFDEEIILPVFVDDHISSGATFRRVMEKLVSSFHLHGRFDVVCLLSEHNCYKTIRRINRWMPGEPWNYDGSF